MAIRIFLLLAIVLLGSCDDEEELHPLKMNRITYTESELRTDGYYYSEAYSQNSRTIAVFYRNGVCFVAGTRIEGQDIFEYIEKDFLLDYARMSFYWNRPADIGVFHINNKSLTFEKWEPGYDDIGTYTYNSEILNDTTFRITKQTNNRSGNSYPYDETFRFKQFIPKPDSTNRFIK
jgi:hypothetical protein